MADCWKRAKCDRCGSEFRDRMYTVILGMTEAYPGGKSASLPLKSLKLCGHCGGSAYDHLKEFQDGFPGLGVRKLQ